MLAVVVSVAHMPNPARYGSGIEILQPMPSRATFRDLGWRRLPGEDPSPDCGALGVGVETDLLLELLLDRSGGAYGPPLALPEVGPAVSPQADDVDLDGLRPVLARFEGGGQALPAIERGEGFPAEALESQAEVGVELGPDQVGQRPLGSHVADVAGAGEDEAEPEAEQRVGQVVADRAGRGLLARQRVAPLDVTELDELLKVIGEAARILAGLAGDVLDRGVAGGNGREDGVVESDLPQLFPQEEVGLAVERR